MSNSQADNQFPHRVLCSYGELVKAQRIIRSMNILESVYEGAQWPSLTKDPTRRSARRRKEMSGEETEEGHTNETSDYEQFQVKPPVTPVTPAVGPPDEPEDPPTPMVSEKDPPEFHPNPEYLELFLSLTTK